MDTLLAFFTSHLTAIYFVYGLAFFVTGVAVWLETSRSSALPTARTLPFLAAFGLIHGGHEWVEMLQLISAEPPTMLFQAFRLLALTASFVLLVEFGLRLLALENNRRIWQIARWLILATFAGGVILIWVAWGEKGDAWSATDAWCRYCLAVPGAVLTAAGAYKQSHHLSRQQPAASRDLLIVGLAFLIYGIPGQVFVGPSLLPPSTVINTTLFMQIFRFPVQLLRTAAAVVVVIFTVRTLRVFELQRERQMRELDQAREEARRRLAEEAAERQALQQALLRQTVQAQETERKHIAREMHDEIGQALTALSWGLVEVKEALSDCPAEVHGRIRNLQRLTDQVMVELRQLTSQLRPAVLDELGLVPALITYADDCSVRFPFIVEVKVTGRRRRLPSEIETSLYRITQEAITNVVKHAQATQVTIYLHFKEQEIILAVNDDGKGMDVITARRAAACGEGWGLAGICERVELLGGHLDIRSTSDAGTEISVRIPAHLREENHEPNPISAGR